MKTTVSVKSFAAMAAVIRAEDVRKAQNLRKSAPLAKDRPKGKGPRIAR